jgi:7-cyano-7-deazaguanine synthase
MSQLDPNHALVVLSGGQDSTTCLGWALQIYQEVSAITFDYDQKHRIELDAAEAVRRYFEKMTGKVIKHEYIELGPNAFCGTSPLISPGEALETYKDHNEMEAIIGDRVEKTFVPMRNAVFLMYAANRAVCAGARAIVTGVCQADNANYPDCRQSFIDATEFMINEALGLQHRRETAIHIVTPLMNLSKAASIKLATQIPHTYDALAYSHTAYDGKYPPTSKDHASVLRAYGFEQAGVPDPLVLRAVVDGLMELPHTANYDTIRATL